MKLRLDGLVNYSRSDLLVDGGVMMTRFGPGWDLLELIVPPDSPY